MKFGDNLRILRKNKGLSQEDLAHKMNVSRQSVSKWETGEAYPEMNNILELCKIFHCKIDDLINDDIIDIDSLDEETIIKVVTLKKEEQKKMKSLSKAIYIIAKIAKIMVTIVIPIIIILMIAIPFLVSIIDIVNDELIINGNSLTLNEIDGTLSLRYSYGNFNILLADASGDNIAKIFNIFSFNSKVLIIIIGELCLIVFLVTAFFARMLFKHLEDLFININNGDTPFTLDNIHHLKRIAHLMILMIVFPYIGEILLSFLIRSDIVLSIELFDVIQILFLLSLTYIFEYGRLLGTKTKGQIYSEDTDIE